jgi:gamma-glutamyltranspeptidase/glutathione hydrolase
MVRLHAPNERGQIRHGEKGLRMTDRTLAGSGTTAWRPTVRGTRHVIAAGHYLAAQAGFRVLEGGGNAIDAGVAAGITLGVVQSDFVNIAGVAPIMIYLTESADVVTISGLGTWPAAATLDLFVREHRGTIPRGLLRTVVPAAPDAWITALERYGTLSFAEVSEEAIRLSDRGFVMYPSMHEIISLHRSEYAEWPENASIYLPGGRVPAVGERFVQKDLARTLSHMADEEQARRSRGRAAGLAAARDAFYRGDIAKTIADYHAGNGGLLTLEDLARFKVEVAPSVTVRYRGKTVHACPPWCQGPVLLQMLKLVEGIDIAALGHNTGAYAHALVEAMKLAFADRERHYGDPRHRRVPLAELLGDSHAAERRRLISLDQVLEARDDWTPCACTVRWWVDIDTS